MYSKAAPKHMEVVRTHTLGDEGALRLIVWTGVAEDERAARDRLWLTQTPTEGSGLKMSRRRRSLADLLTHKKL